MDNAESEQPTQNIHPRSLYLAVLQRNVEDEIAKVLAF